MLNLHMCSHEALLILDPILLRLASNLSQILYMLLKLQQQVHSWLQGNKLIHNKLLTSRAETFSWLQILQLSAMLMQASQ